MSECKDGFDPIRAARTIEDSYRGYIATTIHFADKSLQRQLESLLAEPGYLTRGPFLEAAAPYEGGETPRELVSDGVLCEDMLRLGNGNRSSFDPDRKLYKHQVQALRMARAGQNYIVTTGTGSGKTECFLLPILDDILREFAVTGPQAGVRALVIYPMNALANDQVKRLRGLLAGTPITFGRYTGDTPETQGRAEDAWAKENPGEHHRMPNELISREAMRATPPNILLTNYSMLEYMLLRPKDAPFFSEGFGRTWRHIAIDEAHMYSGALGTEIAYLLRRLKARIGAGSEGSPRLHCYATSATMGSDSERLKIAQFAADLFGESFASGDGGGVIVGVHDSPLKDLRPTWGSLPLDVWGELREIVSHDPLDEWRLRALLGGHLPQDEFGLFEQESNPSLGLGRVLLGEESTRRLVSLMSQKSLDLTPRLDGDVIELPDIAGLDVNVLTDMVEVLCYAQRSVGVPIASSRYHSFLRGPEGLFFNPYLGKLRKEKMVSERVSGIDGPVPVYEIAACRHCGEGYLLGTEMLGKGGACARLDPRPSGDNPTDAEHYDPRVYYRILKDPTDVMDSEQLMWLCPACGSLHDESDGGGHVFAHPFAVRMPIARGKANEENSQCYHCGYSNRYAIQPMRVSPEAVGSVVCYDLVRLVPPFERQQDEAPRASAGLFFQQSLDEPERARRPGNVICFSDRRQDAAYFAPAMERTYNDVTIRQIIREAVDELFDGSAGVLPSSVCDWISDEGRRRYGAGLLGTNARNMALSWMLGEMMTDAPRNSLEALGVVRFEPTRLLSVMNRLGPDVARQQIAALGGGALSQITTEDYLRFVRYCLDSLRRAGAVAVPSGVDRLLKRRTRVSPVLVRPRVDGRAGNLYSFIGNERGSENSRSAFVRRYMRKVHGVELSRTDSTALLSSVYQFLTSLLDYLEKNEGLMLWSGSMEEFRLDMDLWELYPCRNDDQVFVCDVCGCEYHWDYGGVCPTHRCEGHLHETTFDGAGERDAHYKKAYRDDPLPIRIEEHTAQLSSERAREVQNAFIRGEVNVLSCTTTFELGVDVGDLRSVFMRNVPPTAANYTQRAGRVGRRAGKPGYAVTFARLRPHDLALFKDPERIIRGSNPAPCCYLDNEAIAFRHLFAVVLSDYFRYLQEHGNGDAAHTYHAFLDLSKADPAEMDDLRGYLGRHPSSVANQLDRVFEKGSRVRRGLGIDNWSWIDRLVGSEEGRLVHVHEMKSDDYCRVEEAEKRYQAEGSRAKARAMSSSLESQEKQRTIDVLAECGVLPKYGFPTDLVELHIPAEEQSVKTPKLRLQRGLRQAIREYAPGNEVIADKHVWKSVGIRKPRERGLEVRRYGRCPKCRSFVWPIDDLSEEGPCPVCHATVQLTQKMLIPSEGFYAVELPDADAGARRPRARGRVRIEFCQSWEGEAKRRDLSYPGGCVRTRYAANGKLCAMNDAGSMGFAYCPYCGAAAPRSAGALEHEDWCVSKESKHYHALGAAFTSDVLEFRFDMLTGCSAAAEDWESLSWAVYVAACRLLQIPEAELGVTFYQNDGGAFSIMLYDNVPGGAGHVLQLAQRPEDVMSGAYDVVAHCTCGEDTCCYGCLCNYFNQGRQDKLSRGGALKILRAFVLEDATEN